MSLYPISAQVLDSLAAQFDALDSHHCGFVTRKDVESSVWKDLSVVFDSDNDAKITRQEYFEGFIVQFRTKISTKQVYLVVHATMNVVGFGVWLKHSDTDLGLGLYI
jgi:hypothetical protein